jgi:hypothetical protein
MKPTIILIITLFITSMGYSQTITVDSTYLKRLLSDIVYNSIKTVMLGDGRIKMHPTSFANEWKREQETLQRKKEISDSLSRTHESFFKYWSLTPRWMDGFGHWLPDNCIAWYQVKPDYHKGLDTTVITPYHPDTPPIEWLGHIIYMKEFMGYVDEVASKVEIGLKYDTDSTGTVIFRRKK